MMQAGQTEVILSQCMETYPELTPNYSLYDDEDRKKISSAISEIGIENFMMQGWINDPELSKFLSVYQLEDTVLAERLDMAYAIYIRATELLKLDYNASEIVFLE